MSIKHEFLSQLPVTACVLLQTELDSVVILKTFFIIIHSNYMKIYVTDSSTPLGMTQEWNPIRKSSTRNRSIHKYPRNNSKNADYLMP